MRGAVPKAYRAMRRGAATTRMGVCGRALRVAAGAPRAALRPLGVCPIRLRVRALRGTLRLPLTRTFRVDGTLGLGRRTLRQLPRTNAHHRLAPSVRLSRQCQRSRRAGAGGPNDRLRQPASARIGHHRRPGSGAGAAAASALGFSANGDNSPEDIRMLSHVYVLPPWLCYALAVVVIWRYPISAAQLAGIRRRFDRRDARPGVGSAPCQTTLSQPF